MVEVAEIADLVKTSYFISPEFLSMHSFRDWIDNSDGERGSRWDLLSRGYDHSDRFSEWIVRNSIENKYLGLNGVSCHISHGMVIDQDGAEKVGDVVRCKDGDKEYACEEPYKRVIGIKSMPSSKELPQELVDALEAMQYEETELGNEFINAFERNGEKICYLKKYYIGKYIDNGVFQVGVYGDLVVDRKE